MIFFISTPSASYFPINHLKMEMSQSWHSGRFSKSRFLLFYEGMQPRKTP